MRITPALLGHAERVLAELLCFARPADQVLSAYFRSHPELGPRERSLVAEASFAVLRRRRSLAAAVPAEEPRALLVAALARVLGFSARALEEVAAPAWIASVRGVPADAWPDAVRADLPDWLWQRLAAQHGGEEAMRIAQGLLNPAPLDLRVNLARLSREEARARLAADGLDAVPTPFSPAGLRLAGKPAINRHPLFKEGLVEVQDEGSQLLAWLLAPRRGEMVADYCAGAGGKTLALGMLMRGAGRIYAMDISEKRLSALRPRAARAGLNNVHTIVLAGDTDPRTKRLAGKLDRVLVDAPCSGFGTLRRNPDLKWRHDAPAIAELAAKQRAILEAAARLVKPGGRLVYATCSILQEENEAVADAFQADRSQFRLLDCAQILVRQRIALDTGERLRLWPHRHGTDGFFAAVFQRQV
ncbi:MAG TPA: RsmB/NOP family class I SAM-dependent RNA methyltransferase [Burkholderiales bacterium]|nr:RsmB/NOP family class I SAM-dependent RNA methyltransferase [Burkholderiales bacterium]